MSPKQTTTEPVDASRPQTAPTVIVAGMYTDPTTGSVYVHRDLGQTVKPWETEAHISPIDRTERFGDVESWAAYIHRFAGIDEFVPLLTWSERGLRAVLDYHASLTEPGRCQWIAEHPFERTKQWTAWAGLADGKSRDQKTVVEALEDMAPDIKSPVASELMGLLRSLKATNTAEGTVTLREDGTSSVTYSKSTSVQSGGVDVPASIRIEIPVFRGHTVMADVLDADGKATGAQRLAPVPYGLTIRIRVDSNDGKVSFRLSRPQADTVFEAALADRVADAQALLGIDYILLRSTAG